MTLVSIIIPAYRNVATLSRALASIASQRHRNWQVIIACDGSTDGTYEIAQQAAASSSRIMALNLAHGGASKARNAGLAKATGEWVLFLDADDTISPGFLSHMLGVAARNPHADIVACGYRRLDELGRNCGRFMPLPLDKDGLAVCAAGPPGAIHSFIVRRNRVVKCSGFDETLHTNEDWDLWLRLAQDGCRFAVTRRILAQYWSSADSLTRDTRLMLRDARTMLERAHALKVSPVRGLEEFDMRSFSIPDLALRNWMWSAGVAIGQGRELPEVFDDLGPDVDCRYQKDELALRLFNGLVVGSGTGFSALAQRWPGLRDGVDRLLARLAHHVGRDDVVLPISRALQLLIARHGRFRGRIDLGKVLGVTLMPAMPWRGFRPETQADVIVFQVPYLRPITWFSFDGPLLGPLSGADVRRIIRRSLAHRIETRLARKALLSTQVSLRLARFAALTRRVIDRAVPRTRSPVLAGTLGRRVRQIEAGAMAHQARTDHVTVPAPAFHPDHRSSPGDWDRFFQQANPWRYDSEYERIKYARTLSLIRPVSNGHALEIACAEGHFTVDLARRFASVTAFDISELAIERARQRVAGQGDVTFVQGDVFRDGIVGQYDLITCSEMLYFAPSLAALKAVASAIAQALRPGGQFVHAHAFLIGERPDRTAFDWDGTAGGDQVFAIFSNTPGLRHVRAIITDLYRIDLFEQACPDQAHAAPALIETVPLGCTLEDRVAADVVWDGAVVTRSQAMQTTTRTIPVLLFHGIAGLRDGDDDDPFRLPREDFEDCLRQLRRHGYRSLSMQEWDHAARYSGRLLGRPLMITFDALDHAFVKHCWPIVRRNGFQPFIFTTPAELLAVAGTEAIVRDWVAQGLGVGSRLDGRAADTMLSSELLQVAVETRIQLEALTRTAVRSVAPPFGMINRRTVELLWAAGYRRCFMDDGGIANLGGMELAVPRIDMVRETLGETMELYLLNTVPSGK